MELLALHFIFSTSVFGTMFLCMILPSIFVSKSRSIARDRTLSCCNCLATGVFIGMCFLGLMPEVHARFEALSSQLDAKLSFPFAEFVVVVGFFLVLFVEQFFSSVLHSKSKGQRGDSMKMVSYSSVPEETNIVSNGHCHAAIGTRETGGRLLILLLAISAHSFFEGLALGLQTDTVKALNLFIAIILHEALVSAAIGMNIAQQKTSFKGALPYVSLMSVTIPIGIFLGYFIKGAPGLVGMAISGILQGFAAGVFVYISFVEMLPTELALHDHNVLKICFIFVGFLLVTVMNLALDMKS